MVKIIENNLLKIGREPMVILPLRKWQEIESAMEEREELIRFNQAISDSKNQKRIPFGKVKKKLNLP